MADPNILLVDDRQTLQPLQTFPTSLRQAFGRLGASAFDSFLGLASHDKSFEYATALIPSFEFDIRS